MHESKLRMQEIVRDCQISGRGLARLRRRLCKQRFLHLALDSRREIASGHRGPVTCADLHGIADSMLITGSIDKTVALYDLRKIDQDETGKVQASNTSTALLAERADNSVQTSVIAPPLGHEYGVSSVQWYPTDPGVFISSSFDSRVLLWDTETFQPVTHFELGTPVTTARMRAQPDDILIAVAAGTTSIVLLDVVSGAATHRLPGHADTVTCVEWSPINPFIIASGAYDGAVRLFDVRRAGPSCCLLTLDWMQDHTATQTGVWYRRIDRKGDAIAKAHSSNVVSLAFTADGQTLLTAGADEQLRAWDVETGMLRTSAYHGAQLSKRQAPMKVAADDLVFLPSAANNAVVAFDVFGRDGSPQTELSGHFAEVTGICVRESTQQLVTTSTDGLIFVWSHLEQRTVQDTSQSVPSTQNRSIVSYGSGFLGRSGEQSYGSSTHQPAEDVDAWSSDDEAGHFIPPIVDAYLSNPRSRLAQTVAARQRGRQPIEGSGPSTDGQSASQPANDAEWMRESMPLFDPSFQTSQASQSTTSTAVAAAQTNIEGEAGGFVPEAISMPRAGEPEPAQGNGKVKRRISIRAKLTKKMKPHNRLG